MCERSMTKKCFKLPTTWIKLLGNEIEKTYMQELFVFLTDQRNHQKKIYPLEDKIFNAFALTKPEDLKVVILGQDPYHGEGQAHGLSFSVEKGVKVPPSLKNMYKELNSDLQCNIPQNGDLTYWAEQGVLLLNSVLTVEHGIAASHKNQGWEKFTDHVIGQINKSCDNIVFMLWGSYAQKKGSVIDRNKHLILEAVHPSPLSAHRGFFGCKHFSLTNEYLAKKNLSTIDWQIQDEQIGMSF